MQLGYDTGNNRNERGIQGNDCCVPLSVPAQTHTYKHLHGCFGYATIRIVSASILNWACGSTDSTLQDHSSRGSMQMQMQMQKEAHLHQLKRQVLALLKTCKR